MATRIQLRRGTATEWSTQNPTLAVGEMGLELDTKRFKIGTGIHTWNQLGYGENINVLSSLRDVEAVDPIDGSILVYNTSISKWEASVKLEKQEIDSGFF